jgi:hypothetical protein
VELALESVDNNRAFLGADSALREAKSTATRFTSNIQRRSNGALDLDSTTVHKHAAHGVAGAGSTLPHADAIVASFGRHDVSNITAHVGGVASRAAASIGARAYAVGTQVAFDREPDLHTAAHEAAHVVQQRAGVQLGGGVGREGDVYERHADRVADDVVAGRSAEATLDEFAGGEPAVQGRAVQRDDDPQAANLLQLLISDLKAAAAAARHGIESHKTGGSSEVLESAQSITAMHLASAGAMRDSSGLTLTGDSPAAAAMKDAFVVARELHDLIVSESGNDAAALLYEQLSLMMDRDASLIAPPPPPPKYERNGNLESTLKVIAHTYHDLNRDQRDAVEDLLIEANKTDPPGFWEHLIMAGVDVALAGAIGSLGKYVELATIGGKSGNAAKITAKIVSDGTKTTAKKLGRAAVQSHTSSGSTSTQAFWEAQRDALDACTTYARDTFIENEEKFRTSPNGPEEAEAMLKGLRQAVAEAPQVQKNHSLTEWCKYLAESSLGDDGVRGHLDDGALLSTVLGNGKGVLSVSVTVSEPGATPKLKGAWINGLNEGLRKELEKRRFGELNIPMTILARLFGTFDEDKMREAKLEFGIEPNGELTLKSQSEPARAWLKERNALAGDIDETGAFTSRGMQLLLEDMAGLWLNGKIDG